VGKRLRKRGRDRQGNRSGEFSGPGETQEEVLSKSQLQPNQEEGTVDRKTNKKQD